MKRLTADSRSRCARMDPAAVFASLNALGGTPPYTVVIGCEAANVDEGIGLSDAVAAAVPDAVQAIEDVVGAAARRPRQGGLTMCLGIPGQVVGMLEGYGDQLALVDVAGEHRKVNVGMLPEETFAPGDWVIIHMGFVVEKTDKAGADAAMAGLELMGRGRDIEASP